MSAKKELRKAIQKVLNGLKESEIIEQSSIVEKKVLESDWIKKSQKIGLYMSMEKELRTDGIVRWCLENNKEVYIPQFQRGDKTMRMLRLEAGDQLEEVMWGIRQHPIGHSSPLSSPLHAIIIPGMAFSPSLSRLGHGAGHYDRFLLSHHAQYGIFPYRVGICLTEQIVHDLPTEPHDVSIDLLVSPF